MKLEEIAFKSSIVGGLGGTLWHGIAAIAICQPGEPLVPPWGVLIGISLACFWGILYCVTPKKWW